MTGATKVAVKAASEPDAPPEAEDAPAIRHPRDLPRRKMGLFDQEHFLRTVLDRCVMHVGAMKGIYAGEATLTLTREDMAALVCIADTLNLFNVYGAADHVRRQAQRDAERKAAKR